jgi:hypothetical protein
MKMGARGRSRGRIQYGEVGAGEPGNQLESMGNAQRTIALTLERDDIHPRRLKSEDFKHVGVSNSMECSDEDHKSQDYRVSSEPNGIGPDAVIREAGRG